ncbi:MAG: sigma-54 dependent transcriptional regulator [Bryobacteraceae bacterium]|nr:sigma-54 dependent transcriptional regulator [Bryobacteraceae bacterium]
MTETTQFEFLGSPAVVGSAAMRSLYTMVQRVAVTNATVLVTGESGSGKELVARALHHYSLRCSRPWIDVSCAALPEHLIESELFGYEKGAFSGAQGSKPGLFELANLGTLFLDEVGELEPRMQVKLLRVLDGAPYYRLGGTRKISVDVRIVTATNRDLRQEVAQGNFRADLYHRLTQLELKVPPLRERREEIVDLARFFLSQLDRPVELAESAMRALSAYAWPGNLRELRNVVTRAAILAPGDTIRGEDLDLPRATILEMPAPRTGAFSFSRPEPVVEDDAPEPGSALDEMEKRMIMDALRKTGGHHQKAAEMLGISRRTLSRKLKLYEATVEQLA